MKILKQEREKETFSEKFVHAYQMYASMLYRLCYSYMKNAQEAEDIVADVFIKLLEKRMTFHNDEHEKAWLLRTAINLCKDRLKQWWRKRENIDDYYSLPGTDIHYKEDDILKAILELPARYKAAVYLHYYMGYTSAEIAKMLRKPQSTILRHLHEARNILKEVLTDER